MSEVEVFLQKFLKTPKGTSPEVISQKIKYWLTVANNPERYFPDANTAELKYRVIRNARQNVRRLARKHPNLLSELAREMEAEQ